MQYKLKLCPDFFMHVSINLKLLNKKSFYKKGFQANGEVVVQRCSVKKVLLEVSQNSRENTCARVSFSIKLQASCEFAKFLRTPFLTEHLRWLLLHTEK